MNQRVNYEQRLVDIINFMQVIIIAGNGYDIKHIIERIALGQYTYKDAIKIWHRLDYDFMQPYETLIKKEYEYES